MKGEVNDCDVVAVRGREAPVVVELKRALNLDVVLQAVARLSLTAKVYIAVPAKCSALTTRRRHVIKLLRMLGLGWPSRCRAATRGASRSFSTRASIDRARPSPSGASARRVHEAVATRTSAARTGERAS